MLGDEGLSGYLFAFRPMTANILKGRALPDILAGKKYMTKSIMKKVGAPERADLRALHSLSSKSEA